MAATLVPNGHVITQSEQFFGGTQLQISIDHNIKNAWSCPSCGCNNMCKSNSCGLCGILNPKYIVKPKDMHKKSMVTKERIKLLTSKDIFKKVTTQFPQFSKYTTISTPSSKRRKSQKTHRQNLIDNLDLNTVANAAIFTFPPEPTSQDDPLSFIDSVFNNINFGNPFIISDEDEEDPPLSPISDADDINDDIDDDIDDNDALSFLAFSERMNSANTLRDNKLPDITPKHDRTVSFSAPTTPSTRHRDRIKIKKHVAPLVMGVIHTPAPSKENRLNIVLSNVENIVKYEFDGCFFINHGYSANQLVPIITAVHKRYPTLWLGANFMGIPETKIFKFVKTNRLHKILGGVWCENSGICLDDDVLEDIFVHNFYKLTPKVLNLNIFDDIKEDIQLQENQCKLMKNYPSNGSNTSIKSNNSTKKRVTFSTLSNALMNNNDIVSVNVDSPTNNTGTPKMRPIKHNILNHKKYGKKDDSFARSRLNGINKYQFAGLYFGGVDLKTGKCIKIPTQKSIRTRRRTYSAQSADVYLGLQDNKSASPRSPAPRKCDTPQTYIHKYKTQKGFTRIDKTRNKRSISQHSGSPKKHSIKYRNKGNRNSLKLRKSLSSQIIADNDTVLATISGEDEPNGNKTPKSMKKTPDIPKSIKTKSATMQTIGGAGSNYHITCTPKWKSKKLKKRVYGKHNHNKTKTKDKKIYSMTDSEIDDDIVPNASFWQPGLKVANSLDINEVKPKSPITPSYDDDNESNHSREVSPPPPLPKSPSTPTLGLSRNNIKLHNLALHRPLDTDCMDINITHSYSMPNNLPLYDHSTQETQETQETHSSSPSYNSEGEYSHTSQVSEAWSDYGSVNETLDDYFEAMNSLGKFASRGYMDVITTSGRGKNIDIKLKALKEACHKKCLLAVASGIRTENIEMFLPYVDILMVSTCISRDFHVFDPKKMAKFKRTIDDYFAQDKVK